MQYDSSRIGVLTFVCPQVAAHVLTVITHAAEHGTPEHGASVHFHHIDARATVHNQAAGDQPSTFMESGFADARSGLFLSLQRGNNKVVFFYCKAAKIRHVTNQTPTTVVTNSKS